MEELTEVADLLRGTPTHLAKVELLEKDGGIPSRPGLYAWWGAPGLIAGIEGPDNPHEPWLQLLYLGIAPRDSHSASNLRQRVLRKHARGGTGGSTLRRAVAALIGDTEGYQTRHTSRTVLVPEDEVRLSAWIRDNLRVTWAEHPAPWTIESALVAVLQPPLNQAENTGHPLHSLVKEARARWRASAR